MGKSNSRSSSSSSHSSSSHKKKVSPHRQRDRNPFKERKTFYPPKDKESTTYAPRRTKIVVKNSSPDRASDNSNNSNDTITLRTTTVLAVGVASISALSLFVTVLALLIVFSD